MATKKTETAQTSADDQASVDTLEIPATVSTDTGANIAGASDPAAEAPPPAIPDPIFATDDEGRDRPMSGGSFIRQANGTLIRNEDA